MIDVNTTYVKFVDRTIKIIRPVVLSYFDKHICNRAYEKIKKVKRKMIGLSVWTLFLKNLILNLV